MRAFSPRRMILSQRTTWFKLCKDERLNSSLLFESSEALTLVGVTYSAIKYKNNCLTFQSNNGLRSRRQGFLFSVSWNSSMPYSCPDWVVRHPNHSSFGSPRSPSCASWNENLRTLVLTLLLRLTQLLWSCWLRPCRDTLPDKWRETRPWSKRPEPSRWTQRGYSIDWEMNASWVEEI